MIPTADKKYYWLRLPRDFFDKHYIKILRAKEDGKDLILFYINLLTESIDHEAKLRYSDKEPYDIETLAEVTFTDENIVSKAMPLFERLGLVEYLEDGTIFLPKGKEMIGCESSAAERMRNKREQERTILNNVKHSDIEIELEIEKDIEIDIKTYSVFFETLWNEYPRKKEKAKAYKCYQTRIKDGYSDEELLQAVKNYAADCKTDKTEDRYIKLCATFLGPNTPFIDYLDKNYKSSKPQDKPKTNKFNNYPQREYTPEDYAEVEKKLSRRNTDENKD